MQAECRRAKPGAVVEIGEDPPTAEELFEAGYITEAELHEFRAMHDHFRTLPLAARQRGVTLGQVKRDPRFQSRLAHHAGITRTARPLAAARERRASPSASSRGGDSGDSDPHLAGPAEPAGDLDLDVWLADRERVLAALIAGWRA